jgi:xanthine/CO dehydrogenase XdhC/CoxF family maturation factor
MPISPDAHDHAAHDLGRDDPGRDEVCAVANGLVPAQVAGRRLVAVFASPVAAELAHVAAHVGFEVLVLEPDPRRAVPGQTCVPDVAAARLDEHTDVVVTDHDRGELGDLLAAVLAGSPRWVGVMGSPRHVGPHVAALRERRVADDVIARVHRPIGLDIGSRSPAEIAVSTVAGLLADRAGRSGGRYRPDAEPSAR